ncbi:MAG: LacI family DNA-binding transcriptional regulator [Ethanoligenens sp.]
MFLNIHDIAKLAGVSSTTVSRFLNSGYVSDSKREKIQKVIDKTGYTPMLGAQTLRTKRKKLIGVIIPKISSESVSRTVDGISEALSAHGYQILLGNTDNNPEKELEYFSIFQANTDGILFLATILTERHQKLLRDLQTPLVVIGQTLDYCPCVYYDDFGAAKQLTDLLIHYGCRCLGYIGVTNDDRAAGLARQNGFLAAVSEAHMQIPPARMAVGPFSMASGDQNVKEMLAACPDLDGLFCATDSIAVGAMQAIRAMGRDIPGEICVVGIGDSQISKIIQPQLTTVHFHYRTSGMKAAEMLLHMLENHLHSDKKLSLGFEVIERQSCCL